MGEGGCPGPLRVGNVRTLFEKILDNMMQRIDMLISLKSVRNGMNLKVFVTMIK